MLIIFQLTLAATLKDGFQHICMSVWYFLLKKCSMQVILLRASSQ